MLRYRTDHWALRCPLRLAAAIVATCCWLAGCSGGSGGGQAVAAPAPAPAGGNPGGWTAGVYAPASSFAALCANPRSGTDPDTSLPYPDAQGSVLDENNWLRSWSNELYLWYDEIVDRDPGLYATDTYFSLLKTNATTASGQPKDRFHYAFPTDEWRQVSTSGTAAGYGARFAVVASRPPREILVAYTEPGSPAATAPANLRRGARLVEIDGRDIVNDSDQATIDALNEGLSPSTSGQTHTFTVDEAGSLRTFQMTSAVVASDPVPIASWIDTPTGRVGYLLFNSHIGTAEQALIDAVELLAGAGADDSGIDDLVIDMRYNGGGFLFIASELAYMVAGQTATAGRAFELQSFNDKHPDVNPVTGELLEPLPFLDAALGFTTPIAGDPLPTLDLARVYVLTGGSTCSASESIINALRGVGVDVIQIGSTTCGKPYGFYPTDNCGTTYFSIQFAGVNDAGFGAYSDGFSPVNSPTPSSTQLPGCAVADDFDNPLGDPTEARFAAALQYRDFATCPAVAALAPSGSLKPGLGQAAGEDVQIVAKPWEAMRWLSPMFR